MVPKKVFFTKGAGKHKHKLQSFELALRNAEIEKCNLVNVSSIIPPQCKIISREKGVSLLRSGQITYCVLSRISTNEPQRWIGASIGVALPREKNSYGYISEHHAVDITKKELADYSEDLAVTMLATTWGMELDPDKAWDERKQEYKMSGRIIRTQNITQTARGDKNGWWTTVIAAAVFLEE
jgi:arginine decarboxylase